MLNSDQNRAAAPRVGPWLLFALLPSTLSLWVVDCLVNLEFSERLILDSLPLTRWQDFAGLLLSEVPVSIVISVVAGLGAFVFVRFSRRSRFPTEVLALCPALLAAITVPPLLGTAWRLRSTPVLLFLGLCVVPAIGLWVGARVWLRRAPTGHAFAIRALSVILLCPLFAALANLLAARLFAGDWPRVGAVMAWLVGLSTLAAFLIRSRSRTVGIVLALTPVLVALGIGAASIISSAEHGKVDRAPGGRASANRPSIVLIVLDTVRADHLKSFGYARDTMPALERWSETALVATKAVSTAGWTAPSHASMFSGKPVSLHGIHYDADPSAFRTQAFDGIEWLPARLAQEGYSCYAVSANPVALPEEITGFSRRVVPDRGPWYLGTIGAMFEHYSRLPNPLSERLRWRLSHADAQQITRLVRRSIPEDESPVFLFVNFLDAHAPYNPPAQALASLGVSPRAPFSRYWLQSDLTKRWESLPEGTGAALRDLYDGELRWVDMNLERLLDWIDQRFGEDAVVIVTSDHGEELGEEGRVGHEYGVPQPVIHVPLVIRSPGLGSGRFNGEVSLRRIHDLVVLLGTGQIPDRHFLESDDGFGVLSERYVSGRNVAAYGPAYDRPWVSLIEEGRKGLGPSDHGFRVLDLTAEGFGRGLTTVEVPSDARLRAKIDEYWGRFHDARGFVADRELTSEEREQLRSLGYVQ